eukprot:scaffold3806_cov41-Cyclotella_meneghiniana.AAC.10
MKSKQEFIAHVEHNDKSTSYILVGKRRLSGEFCTDHDGPFCLECLTVIVKISLPSLDKQAKEFIASGETLKTLKVRELTSFYRAAPPVNEWKVGEDAVKWKKDVTTKGDKGKQHEPPAGKKGKGKQHKPPAGKKGKSKKPTPVDSDATYVPNDYEVKVLQNTIRNEERVEKKGVLSDEGRKQLEVNRAKLKLWMKNRERQGRAEIETKNKKKAKPKIPVS